MMDHLGLGVSDYEASKAFYLKALAPLGATAVMEGPFGVGLGVEGGQDNGAPGLRPHYHANYFGAFVIGPDGHNIEAVCHRPEP